MLADLHDLAVLSFGTGDGHGSAIALSGVALAVSVRRNVLVGRTAIFAGGDAERVGVFGAALRIEDNVAVGLDAGIDLGGRSAYLLACRVGRNEVLAATGGGIVATGAVAPGATLDVVGNRIATSGAGITVGPDATVDSNAVNALGTTTAPPTGIDVPPAARGTDGIVVDGGPFTTQAGHVRVTGNRVHDRAGTGIVLRTAVQTWIVKENVVQNAGAGIEIDADGQADRAAVDNNQVVDIATTQGSADGAFGIGLVRVTGSVSVVGNTVARVGLGLSTGILRAGIFVLGSSDVHVSGNVVEGIGPTNGFTGLAVGIAVLGPFDTASVSDNTSRFTPGGTGPQQGFWLALLIGSLTAGATGFGNHKAIVPVGNGSVVFTRAGAFFAAAAPEHTTVSANVLAGGGVQPACLVSVTGDVVAQGNQADYEGEPAVGVRLQATSITAATNRVRGTRAMLVLQVDPKRFAAVGNLAPGGTRLASPSGALSDLPAPWAPLNPSV
jgi:hypothetical protein